MLTVTIDPDNGYLAGQPKATQDFLERKIVKASTRGDIALRFKGDHYPAATDSSSRLALAGQLGRNRAEDFKTVTPWAGV